MRGREHPSDESGDAASGSVSLTTDALAPDRDDRGVARLEAGARFGRYRVDRLLGQGGMGSVYLAHDDGLGRPVALKVMRDLNPTARARFVREARAAGSLRHPNVSAVYESGEVAGVPFLAMEYVDGRVLRALVGDASVSVARRVGVLTDVARGLAAVHLAGLVHRDVKPENVIVRTTGEAVVIDFGLAHRAVTASGEGALTLPGVAPGTPAYMAPEQVRADDVDARADQFAWGVLALELLSGAHPFAGGKRPTMVAILDDEPAGVDGLDVPQHVTAAVRRALAKRPADRFVDMDALIAQFVDGRGPPTRTTSFRRRALAASLAGVALAGTLAFVLSRGPRDDPSTARAATSASAPPSARAVATTIARLPLPVSRIPEAVSAYAAGLQALEDNDWDAARARFAEASSLDPDLAEAYVQRLVVQVDSDARDVKLLHELHRQGVRLRGKLSERDRALLDAHEPLAAREPQDLPAYRERVKDAAARFPNDVQIALLAAMELGDPAQAIEAFDRILAMDPDCANARQLKARHQLILGRSSEALSTLDECVERSPASQCLEQRIAYWAEQGQCDRMERDAREWVAKSAGSAYAYYLLANALARDATDDGALEALRQRASTLSGEPRAIAEAVEPAKLDVLRGRFDRAEARARALLAETDASPNARPHAAATSLLVDVLAETGRTGEAGELAGTFLRRRRAWNQDGGIDDGVPTMLAARLHAGLADPDVTATGLANWIEEKQRSGYVLMFPYFGVYAHARMLDTRGEAESAQALAIGAFPAGQAYLPILPGRALHARVLALLGASGAIEALRGATRQCAPLEDPFVHTWAQLWLGDALADAGEVPDACASYGVVRARWGGSRSLSAARARARAATLGCR